VRRVAAGSRTTTTWLGVIGAVGDSVGSNGTAARFGSPISVRFTPDGTTAYVTDFATHKLLKVTVSTTAVTLFAGSTLAAAGNADGTGTSASFNQPADLLIRPTSLDMYLTENGGNRVRKVTSAAVVSIFAGSTTGINGFVNAATTSARFDKPYGIVCIESSGTFFVADQNNKVIRMITAAGVVTTAAGNSSGNADGIGTAAQFVEPWGLALDKTNTYVYIADKGNNAIRRMDVTTFQVDRVVGDLTSNWTSSTNSIVAKIGAPTSLCFLYTGHVTRLYITGDHSISYVATTRTKSLTLTIQGPTTTNGNLSTTLIPTGPGGSTLQGGSTFPPTGPGGSTLPPNGTFATGPGGSTLPGGSTFPPTTTTNGTISAAVNPASVVPVLVAGLLAALYVF
jgi:hypothetical protein